ncbi:hypothetical protein PUN28_019971 [Cardiocondyla obscurior]|uniref:Uncharacterized protein n=1 Tax=Cardiocondyla obscurior TaxID=286306 RepID=A0AAW2ECC8_9HYME
MRNLAQEITLIYNNETNALTTQQIVKNYFVYSDRETPSANPRNENVRRLSLNTHNVCQDLQKRLSFEARKRGRPLLMRSLHERYLWRYLFEKTPTLLPNYSGKRAPYRF